MELKTRRYHQAMGRLGYLSANPSKADPAELSRLAEALMLEGATPKSDSDWLTERQLRRREEREVKLGEHIERASRRDGRWTGTLPKLKRITQSEY